MSQLRKVLVWAIGLGVLAALLALGVLISAPLWINQDGVKRQVNALISRATGGAARYSQLDLRFFPLPGVTIVRPSLDRPGVGNVRAESVSVTFDIRALLTGSVRIRGVHVEAPRASLEFAETNSGAAKPSRAAFERQLKTKLAEIAHISPAMETTVDNGWLELRVGERPPLALRHIDARLEISGDDIRVKVSGSSDLWGWLSLTLRLSTSDFHGDTTADVSGLQLPLLGEWLRPGSTWRLTQGDVTAKVEVKLNGLADVNADAIASVPRLTLEHDGNSLAMGGAVLSAGLRIAGNSTEAIVHQLYLDSPHLMLSGRLSEAGDGVYRLEGNAHDVDLDGLQSAGHNLMPGLDAVMRPTVRTSGGQLTSLQLSSVAAAASALFRPEALRVQAEVGGVDLFFPGYDIRLNNVSGEIAFDKGEVRLQRASAHMGKSIARDVSVATRLGSKPLPLQAQGNIVIDLPEMLALARRLPLPARIHRELRVFRDLQGNARAHVAVGGDFQNIEPSLELSQIEAYATHDALPLPVAISAGRLKYAKRTLVLERLTGRIGNTAFSGVDAMLGVSSPYPLRIERLHAVVALAELLRILGHQPDLAQSLEDVRMLSGTLAITGSEIEGSLRRPKDFRFRLEGRPEQVLVDAPRFGPPLSLHGGVIDISHQSVDIADVTASTLDAVLRLSARADRYRDDLQKLQASAGGRLGPEAVAWVHDRTGLPQALQIRAPLSFNTIKLEWMKDGPSTLTGSLQTAVGGELRFDVLRSGRQVVIRDLHIHDAVSEISLGGQISGKEIDVRVDGLLTGPTMESVLIQPWVTVGELRGDLVAHVDLAKPARTTALGTLRGSSIVVPRALADPLSVEKFSMTAKHDIFVVNSATIASGKSRVDLNGNVRYRADKFLVDADIRGETVILQKPTGDPKTPSNVPAEPAEAATAHIKLGDIPVNGRIRVDIRHLQAGRFDIAPLVAEASLDNNQLELSLTQAALCSIAMTGGLSAHPGGTDLNVSLKSRDAPLAQSINCLTDGDILATGRFDLDAQLSARGTLASLRNSVRGDYSATARDGNIQQLEVLNRVFSILNVTELVRGKLPDMRRGPLRYDTLRVKGRIKGEKLSLEEAVLDGPTVRIAASGEVDYGAEQLNVQVLVAPLQTANYILDKVPLLNRIFGGAVLALPVQVSGRLDNPTVIPLGPQALGGRMLEIITNTLKLPVDAISNLAPARAGKPTDGPAP